MKIFLTYTLLFFSLNTFCQNKSQEQLNDSVSVEKFNTHSLKYMMLYPTQPNNIIIEPVNNKYSFQTNNTKAMKVMSVVGTTLKSVLITKGIDFSTFDVNKPKSYRNEDY